MRPGGVFCLRSNYRCGAGRRGSAEEGERPGYVRSTTARKICLHTRHRNAGTRGELHAQLAAVFHCQRPAAFIDAGILELDHPSILFCLKRFENFKNIPFAVFKNSNANVSFKINIKSPYAR